MFLWQTVSRYLIVRYYDSYNLHYRKNTDFSTSKHFTVDFAKALYARKLGTPQIYGIKTFQVHSLQLLYRDDSRVLYQKLFEIW